MAFILLACSMTGLDEARRCVGLDSDGIADGERMQVVVGLFHGNM